MVRRLPVSFTTAPLGSVADEVLGALRSRPDAASVIELSRGLGLHANTIRLALRPLQRVGLVARQAAPAHGRGRPAYVYTATAEARLAAKGDPSLDEYRGLTAALVAHLSESADAPGQARLIGRHWGRHVVDDPSGGSVRPAEKAGQDRPPRQAIVDMLQRLGFSPAIDDGGIALRTCPLLDLAREHPDVVCAIHAGLIDGAQERLGHEGGGAELRPFAEVGACRLRLAE